MSIDISVCWCASKNFAKLLCMPKNAAKVMLFCQIVTIGIVCYSLKICIFALENNNVSIYRWLREAHGCICDSTPQGNWHIGILAH